MFLPLSVRSVILFPAHSRTLDRAFSSGGERFPDTEEVRSSNLLTPTKCSQLRAFASELFCFTPPSQKGAAAPKTASTAPITTPDEADAAPTPLATIPTGPQAASMPPAANPTKLTVAQTVLASASPGPGWASQPYPGDPRKSKVNGFPRSERAKMNPRSIDTFGGSFPAVLPLESCGFGAKKCGCFGGPKTLVHFTGNHSPSIRRHPLRRQRPTYQC